MGAPQDRHYRNFADKVQRPDQDVDLSLAALLIAQPEYPHLDIDLYLERIDHLAERVIESSGNNPDPFRTLAILNHVLFEKEGFRGNASDYYDPRNSFLNDVIDRRKGIPISLSVLYMEVATRAGLTLEGVSFPGHFLVKFVQREQTMILDPFYGGEVQSSERLENLLQGIYGENAKLRPEFLESVSKKQILHRMLNNLKTIYLRQNDLPRALSAVERLAILEPESSREIRDRGLIYMKLGWFPQALADLESYLSLEPYAEDADEIRESVHLLKDRRVLLH